MGRFVKVLGLLAVLLLPSMAMAQGGHNFAQGSGCELWVLYPPRIAFPDDHDLNVQFRTRTLGYNTDWQLLVSTDRGDLLDTATADAASAVVTTAPAVVGEDDLVLLTLTSEDLISDTDYFWRVRCRETTETKWTFGKVYTMRTSPSSDAQNVNFKFGIGADDHIINSIATGAVCGTDLKTDHMLRFASSIWKVKEKWNEYSFLAMLGDNLMTQCGGCADCNWGIKPERKLSGEGHANTDLEAEARVEKWMNLMSAFSYVAPVFLTGNHEPETNQTAAGTDDTTLQGWNEFCGHNQAVIRATRRARLKHMSLIQDDAEYTRTGTDQESTYSSFEIGDALFIVLDPYLYTDNDALNGPPRFPDDWRLGPAGCTLGVDCEQEDWFNTLVDNTSKRWIFVMSHQQMGGVAPTEISGTGGGSCSWYARGGLGAKEGTIVDSTTGRCRFRGSGVSTGKPCSKWSNAECEAVSEYCDMAFQTPDVTNDFLGQQQQKIELKLSAAATRNGGASFFVTGHDHFLAIAENRNSSGPTGVFYILAGKFSGPNYTGWAGRDGVRSQYNYAALIDGAPDIPPLEDPGDGFSKRAVYDTLVKCSEKGYCGTMDRGFLDVTVDGDNSVTFAYLVSDKDNPFNPVAESILPHIDLVVDRLVPYAGHPACKHLLIVEDTDITTVEDDCLLAANPNQYGGNDMVAGTPAATAAIATWVPGVYGPGGVDPRRSILWDVANAGSFEFTDAGNLFDVESTGGTVCSWVRFNGGDGNIMTVWAKLGGMLFRLVENTRHVRFRFNGVNYNGPDDSMGTTPAVAANHVCATWEGEDSDLGQIRLWVDGLETTCNGNPPGHAACRDLAASPASGPVDIGGSDTGTIALLNVNTHETMFTIGARNAEQICHIARCGANDDVVDRGFACTLPVGQACTF